MTRAELLEQIRLERDDLTHADVLVDEARRDVDRLERDRERIALRLAGLMAQWAAATFEQSCF